MSKQIHGYRKEEMTELKARSYVRQSDRLAQAELRWLVDVFPGLGTDVKGEVAGAVLRCWSFDPWVDSDIEQVIIQICKERPDEVSWQEALARYRIVEGRFEDAYAICISIPNEKHTDTSLRTYCEVLRQMNDVSPMAFSTAQRYWSVRPDDVENTVFLSRLCLQRKDVGMAENVIRRGLEKCPTDTRLRYHLAISLKLGGRLEECIAEPQDLLRAPDNESYRSHDEVRLLMARCLVESGMYEAAMRQLQGMARGREVLELIYSVGLKYIDDGDYKKARDCWEEIYGVDVRFKDVATRVAAGISEAAP